MKTILNNPYRTVGLLVGATVREQERQVKRLKHFIEAEQDPEEDFNFPILGQVHRTIENINDAASKLNLDIDKMNAALFWFYQGNVITDEPAFDAIKQGDLETAVIIWTKQITNGEITQHNASAYNNLGTLYLSGILKSRNTSEELLEKGISLKLKFLESVFVNDLKALATDETFKITKKELQLLFLNQVQADIENSGLISSNNLFDILTRQEIPYFSARDDFMKGFVQKQIDYINRKIEKANQSCKEKIETALSIGKALYKGTSEQLKQIKSILGTSNLYFIEISDKVSEKILQCGIDYLNAKSNDVEISDIDKVKEIINIANGIAISNITKQRCQDNLNAINQAKYNDCFQLVGLLKEIKSKYEEETRNFNYRDLYDPTGKSYVSVSKVKDLLKKILTDDIIVKIAKSNNNELITSYLDVTEFLFNKYDKDFFVHSRVKLFYESLPSNSIFKDRVISYAKKVAPTFNSVSNNVAENPIGGCLIQIIGGFIILIIFILIVSLIGNSCVR